MIDATLIRVDKSIQENAATYCVHYSLTQPHGYPGHRDDYTGSFFLDQKTVDAISELPGEATRTPNGMLRISPLVNSFNWLVSFQFDIWHPDHMKFSYRLSVPLGHFTTTPQEQA
jgi:hypothetical protein